jgi:very-short-patch-repair endonuclease
LPEIILWGRLKGRQLEGYKFRRQYGVENFVIDFYCPELKLAVEIDGDSHYIHPHPLLGKEGNKGRLSDRERQMRIEIFGIQFLRFTNLEIYENLGGVLAAIVKRIKQITSPSPPSKGGD